MGMALQHPRIVPAGICLWRSVCTWHILRASSHVQMTLLQECTTKASRPGAIKAMQIANCMRGVADHLHTATRLKRCCKIHIIRIRKFKARITATRLSNVVDYANTTTVHSNEALKHCGEPEPRATPSQLHRELLPVNCTESYSRFIL